MPFPNEHAARQNDPKKYETFRRGTLPGAPAGVSVIWGIRNVYGKRTSEIQSLRFDRTKFSVDEAKKWLKDHNFKTSIEPASKPVKKQDALWDGPASVCVMKP